MKIDCRGLSCPEPVVLTMEAVNAGEHDMEIITDSHVSTENVIRFLENKGFKTEVKSEGEDSIIVARTDIL